jgi:hypothetical protein
MGRVRFRHHRGHSGSNIFVDKFCPDMSVEYFAEVLHRGIFGHGNISPLSNCDKRPPDHQTHNRFDGDVSSCPQGLGQAHLTGSGDWKQQPMSAKGR